MLPRWLQEKIAGAFGADRVLADRDETQRDGLRGAGASARRLTGRTTTPDRLASIGEREGPRHRHRRP